MYDGWQKVPVPISERDVAIEREKRQKQKAKPKANVKRPGRAAKGKKKARADDVDMDVDGDDDDDSTQTGGEDEKEEEILNWCAYVNTFDVCITTYNVLQQDLGVARPPPTRPRRAFVKYSTVNRSRSPLIMCEWYRVIMDEVQMVGGGKTECVLRSYDQSTGADVHVHDKGDGIPHPSAVLVCGLRNAGTFCSR